VKVVISAALALFGLAIFHVAPAQAAPPVSAFGRLPAIESAVISPDGSRVALLGGPPDSRIIFLAPVDGQDSVTVKLGDAWVRDIQWVGNAYLVVNFTMLDKGTDYSSGREYAYSLNRNVVINMQGKLVASLLANTEWSRYAVSQPILGVLDGPRPTATVLGLDLSAEVYVNNSDTRIKSQGGDLIAALWNVDVTTGKGRIAERGNPLTRSWRVDAAGEARVRWDYDGDADEFSYFVRAKGKGGWSALGPLTAGGAMPDILGYSDADDSVYLLSRDAAGVSLLRRGLADGVTTPVALDKPATDLHLQWDSLSLSPVAIVTATDRPSYQWLDPQLAAVHARLTRAFAGRHVQLASWSKDRSLVVVRVDAPDSLPAWFLFDTRTNQASSLGESYPELAGAPLGKTTWMTYKARDGLEIPAYLTLPPGLAEGAKPPLIVMPHGGPASRDNFEFDWWVQALATRGYAVLQPQFRGSSGFGDAFERAGHRQWGDKMQTDLIDGILALAAKGTIDPDRVGIVGASYGGYAALFGATVYPSAYKCGVSVNGVAHLALLIGSKRRAYGNDTSLVNALVTMMGDSTNNPEGLRVASPVFRVTSQAAPILLIHGQDDTTVPFEQSRSMQRALRAAGKPGDLVVLKGDDHHLSSSATRIQMLEAQFAFLDRCLPVGP
jgi:dienelactone hydrolase